LGRDAGITNLHGRFLLEFNCTIAEILSKVNRKGNFEKNILRISFEKGNTLKYGERPGRPGGLLKTFVFEKNIQRPSRLNHAGPGRLIGSAACAGLRVIAGEGILPS
jgi:hypothetical protein